MTQLARKTFNERKFQEIINFFPHEKQQLILDSTARDITICAGRRFGKSALCGYIALREVMRRELAGEKDIHVWIVAPTYDLASKVFDYIVRYYVQAFPEHAGSISYRPFAVLKTPKGSWIKCKSTENPTGLLGEELDLIIVDEAARIQRKIWETYIFPTTASRKGKSIFISTPFGKNWFYEQWMMGRAGASTAGANQSGSFRFHSIDNPSFPKEEWERARIKLPENVFKQEYLAEFLDDAAAVFRGIKDIVGPCLEDAREGHRYIMGVDLAKYRDFTVLTVIDVITHNVVYWDRFNILAYGLQKARIIEVAKRYHARIVIDSTGVGDPISEDIQREGIIVDDFKFTNKSKEQLVQKLSLFIEQKAITIPANDTLIDELETFGYELTDSGHIKYGAPAGLHDDAVVSLGLAVWGLLTPKRQGKATAWDRLAGATRQVNRDRAPYV